METYFAFLILLMFAAGTAGGMIVLTERLGPKRRGGVHDLPFESGKLPREVVRGRFSVKFFVVALLFVLFDVELVFLFPWAVVYRDLGGFGLASMLVFLLVVLAGLYYSIKRGAFEWN
jgi:NADH-quinone oxidoreductase subunit A